MTIPAGVATVTVTFDLGAGGVAAGPGSIEFAPSVPVAYTGPGWVNTLAPFSATVSGGAGSIVLPANDDTAGNPTSWTYLVTERFGGSREPYHIAIMSADGPVQDYSTIVPIPSSSGTAVVRGPVGPVNPLGIGAVTTIAAGGAATASITGSYPSDVLNLGLPAGPTGTPGAGGIPPWAPATVYTLGKQVASPNNDVVSAIAAHTSGATYNPANWNLSANLLTPAVAAITYASMVHEATVTPEMFGAVGNGREVKGGTITSGTLGSLVDTTNSPFTAASVGMAIMVYGAGAAGVPLVTTIATYVSATTVTLTVAASTAVASVAYRFGTDDTAAIQAAMDAACPSGTGQGVVQFAAKTYVLATAPRHDRSGNAILAPIYNDVSTLTTPPGVLHLQGPVSQSNQPDTHPVRGGTILMPILPAQTYSGSYGPPSVLGGPTVEVVGTNTHFANLNITLENVYVWLTQDSTLAGVDFGYCADATVKGAAVQACAVGQADMIQPTHVWAFGFRMPMGANYGIAVVDGCLGTGLYLGLTGDDHLDLRGWIQNRCYIGYAPSSLGSMPTIGTKIQSQECTYHIAGWTVTAGLANIPTGTMLNVQMFKVEDITGKWYSTTAHVYDPTNNLTGIIVSNFSTLILNGAQKVDFKTISTNGRSKIGSQVVIDCTAIPYNSCSGTFIVEYNAATWHSTTMRNTSGAGGYMTWSFEIEQGTYNVSVFSLHNTYGGQYTLKQNSVTAIGGTVDTYSATVVPTVDSFTNVAFGGGQATLRFDVTGKNTSSSSYTIQLTKIILQRVS